MKFLEEYVKTKIINEFEAQMALWEDADLSHLRGLGDPVLTTFNVDPEETMKKFALCNVGYVNMKNGENEIYNISGLISTLNNGRIIIINYDKR